MLIYPQIFASAFSADTNMVFADPGGSGYKFRWKFFKAVRKQIQVWFLNADMDMNMHIFY